MYIVKSWRQIFRFSQTRPYPKSLAQRRLEARAFYTVAALRSLSAGGRADTAEEHVKRIRSAQNAIGVEWPDRRMEG